MEEEKVSYKWGGKREGAGRKKGDPLKKIKTEKQNRKKITIRFDEENYQKLCELTERFGISQSDLINQLVSRAKI